MIAPAQGRDGITCNRAQEAHPHPPVSSPVHSYGVERTLPPFHTTPQGKEHKEARSAPGPRVSEAGCQVADTAKASHSPFQGAWAWALSSVQRTAQAVGNQQALTPCTVHVSKKCKVGQRPRGDKALLQTRGDHGQPSPLYGPQAPTL